MAGDVMDKEQLAKLIEEAIAAIPGIDARNVVIEVLRTNYNCTDDCSKARVELTFEYR